MYGRPHSQEARYFLNPPFLHESAFLPHEISKSANRKRDLLEIPPHCSFVSDSTDLQIRVADGNRILSFFDRIT